jgi:large subunit ribosomal protein L6
MLCGKLRFKQALPLLALNFYQIKPSRQFKITRNQMNLTRAHIEQYIVGAMVGFKNALRVRGVGYRFDISPLKIIVHAGYSHVLNYQLSRKTLFESLVSNKKSTLLRVKSADLPSLSIFLSTIRNLRYPDVYKGKGIRYQKEFIIRKEGKKKKTA